MWLNEKNSPEEADRGMKDELQFLNDQVLELNQKLKEAENYKSHFLSNIRNEILDPFSSVVTLSRAMLDMGENDQERVKKVMSLIYQETFSLDLHLKNIFYAAEIESGELQPSFACVDGSSLLTEINSTLKPFLVKKKIRLVHPKSIRGTFHSDGEKIQQIILNLTYSLVKACRQGNSIFLNIYFRDNFIHISIFNLSRFMHEGTPEEISFREFHASVKSIEGVHLSVAESLVDFLNGRLEVGIKDDEQIAFKLKIPTSEDEGEDIFADQSIFFG